MTPDFYQCLPEDLKGLVDTSTTRSRRSYGSRDSQAGKEPGHGHWIEPLSLTTDAILPLSQLLKWETLPQRKRCGTVRKRHDLHINLHSLQLDEYNLLYMNDLALEAADLKSAGRKAVGVQIPSGHQINQQLTEYYPLQENIE